MKYQHRIRRGVCVTVCTAFIFVQGSDVGGMGPVPPQVSRPPTHAELPDEYSTPPATGFAEPQTSPAGRSVVGSFASVQVNVDANGNNILWDAGNEPSIAVDPTDPTRIAIGWRQFDTIHNSFRQAGWGYSEDGGQTWTFPDVIERGTFRSDPVLDFDAEGNFYYNSLSVPNGAFGTEVFRSTDGGQTWGGAVFAFGGDKQWMTIDRTDGIGRGNIYHAWSINAGCCGAATFNRSTQGGLLWETPIQIPLSPRWGTLSVGPDGEVYVAGLASTGGFGVVKSSSLQDPGVPLTTAAFELATTVYLGGGGRFGGPPNPGGLLGQVWVATDHSTSVNRGNVYLLSSVDPPGGDPLDVMFARSTDGGVTWSAPVRVNDDPIGNGAYQWMGTMSTAPNGRIDVIWNDTRHSGAAELCQLFYASSTDGGVTWSANIAVSEVFNSVIGWPSQNKIGDYYDMVSDNFGASVAYSATFTGGQDVYYLRIGAFDCNDNGVPDSEDIASQTSTDCNGNNLPDECESDCNSNGQPDPCDIANGSSLDCDQNFLPDDCQPDYDGDGAIDACDPDVDGDGVNNGEDECAFTPPGTPVQPNGGPMGDTDLNCLVDAVDTARFGRCLSEGGPAAAPGPAGCLATFDFDANGRVDLADVAAFQGIFGAGGE